VKTIYYSSVLDLYHPLYYTKRLTFQRGSLYIDAELKKTVSRLS